MSIRGEKIEVFGREATVGDLYPGGAIRTFRIAVDPNVTLHIQPGTKVAELGSTPQGDFPCVIRSIDKVGSEMEITVVYDFFSAG